jgi:hypothetical protein
MMRKDLGGGAEEDGDEAGYRAGLLRGVGDFR